MAERARTAVVDIAATLKDHVVSPALADGAAGRALFFRYLADLDPNSPWISVSEAFLDQSIDRLAEIPLSSDLYTGFSGVAWVVEHLRGRLFDVDDDPNEPLEGVLCDFLRRVPWRGDFDLILGLAGLGVYALERTSWPLGRECLSLVVDRLADEALSTVDGCTWLSRPEFMRASIRASFPGGYFNLGVAHGVPGVLPVLAGAARAGVNVSRAHDLLNGAVRWLLSNRLPLGARSMFPTWVAPGHTSTPARSAWCYGDPGAAAALFAAASAVEQPAWQREALAIARHAAMRPMEHCDIHDAGLCHGAAGLALLYNRFWQCTGDDAFKRAAIQWYTITIQMRSPGVGLAGYRTFFPKDVDRRASDWLDDASFLTGVCGIGLSLLAGISETEPEWDRLMAVSLRCE